MIDINREQRRASNPLSSVWVGASAGSGKTKVLTDRVLNLLLMTGRPDKLLCLTFTKAAAAEMSNRINQILKQWAICSDSGLRQSLIDLTGEEPESQTLTKARRLFAQVLETAGGLKMMTIHSFCQSVLKRFPLEAGVSPDFDIMDDLKAQSLINTILDSVLCSPDFHADLKLLARYKTQDDLIKLMQDLFSHRGRLMALREQNSLQSILARIKKSLNLSKYDTATEVISEYFDPKDWDEISKTYLKKDGTVQKRKAGEEVARIAQTVAQNLKNLTLVNGTQALLHLAYTVLEQYQAQKQNLGLLDYDDLIDRTKSLLTRNHAASWVLFKLDGGLDHILIDEAQDTNPDQWAVVRLLAEEFFAGEDHHDTIRTIFAVGDKKQSIYSFQGADPTEFERMRQFFENKVRASQNTFENVPFNLSFRSTQPILTVVNNLFKHPQARQGVLAPSESGKHTAYRMEDAGLVEVWPLEAHQKSDEPTPWKPPIERTRNKSALSRLAEKIADKIADSIGRREILPSQGRPIQAGDFLILVQRRNQFVTELVRLLKDRNIPVAGVDRLNLTQHIAIQDLMAAAKFALLPTDDLNLACLLKSPLIHLSEEDLFQAAYGRGNQSLWDRVQNLFPDRAERLKLMMSGADKVPPYEFFAHILGVMGGRKAFIARLGIEVEEALDEFLTLALDFGQNNIPSLQGFIDMLSRQDLEIKRDMESGQNAVRIMTVHGSKGLQGNIVFLPQTRFISRQHAAFIWLEGKWPLWVMGRDDRSQTVADLLKQSDQKDAEENKRLLYVAVTRAADRLYICGYENAKKPDPDNWYDLICQSLSDYPPDENGIIRIESPQKRPVTPKGLPSDIPAHTLPDWAKQPAPTEPTLSKPLSPSRLAEPEPITDSPLSDGQMLALRRGSFIHQLLQYLPTIPQESWPRAIAHLKPADIEIPDNLNALLTNPEFEPIFGPNSLSEVPIVGVWQGQAISGQIDRLVVWADEIWIVDFKTNRHVPQTATEIPTAYRTQLAAYRGLMSQVYPDRHIRTFLLWTENLTLTELTADS